MAVHAGSGSRLRRRVHLVALTLVMVVVLRWLVVEAAVVHSSSMEPTFGDGDVVVVDRLSHRFGAIDRGDVVVVDLPGADGDVIKRVVGVAGDVVGIEDGELTVNGHVVPEPYLGEPVPGSFFGPVDVPPGHVFLLGDNRVDSVDSRMFGPVPIGSVEGEVRARVWPLG